MAVIRLGLNLSTMNFMLHGTKDMEGVLRYAVERLQERGHVVQVLNEGERLGTILEGDPPDVLVTSNDFDWYVYQHFPDRYGEWNQRVARYVREHHVKWMYMTWPDTSGIPVADYRNVNSVHCIVLPPARPWDFVLNVEMLIYRDMILPSGQEVEASGCM